MTGGQTPYSYNVNGVTQSEPEFSGLSEGEYEVKVTDANGCEITETTVINNVDGPELITEIKPVTCGLANGMVQLSASGGTAPYTYYLGDSESSTGEYSGLSSGDYVAKVVDANGCEALLEITIGSVTSDMSMSIIATPSTCGQSNGTISASNDRRPVTL